MNLHTALLDVRRMIASDRLAVAAGLPAAALMNNAGYAVAEEIKRRWTATQSTTMNAGGAITVMDRPSTAGAPARISTLFASFVNVEETSDPVLGIVAKTLTLRSRSATFRFRFPRQTRRRCPRLRLPASRFPREVPAP